MSHSRAKLFTSVILNVAMLIGCLATPADAASAAQTSTALPDASWVVQFGTEGDDGISALEVAPNGDVIVAGYTFGSLVSPNAGESDVWVAAYDNGGQQLWLNQYGDATMEGVWSIAVDNASNIYLAITGAQGSTKSTSTLLSLDSNGNQRWEIELPNTVAMGLATDGSVLYWVGAKEAQSQDVRSAITEIFVVAIEQSGTVMWTKESYEEYLVIPTAVAVNNDTVAIVGAEFVVDEPEFVFYPQSVGGTIWAAILDVTGESHQIDPVDFENGIIFPIFTDRPVSIPSDVLATDLPGGFTMIGTGEIRRQDSMNDGEMIGWVANRRSTDYPTWEVTDFRLPGFVTALRGITQIRPGDFVVSGLESPVGDQAKASAWLGQADAEGYFDWLVSFGTTVTEITSPDVDSKGNLYVAGATKGDIAGATGGSDIWLARLALNDLGMPQFPPGLSLQRQQTQQEPDVTAAYDNLAGTIVFLANFEATDNETSPMLLPHHVYAVRPDGTGLARISSEALQPWAGASVSPDGRYVALSTASSASDSGPEPIHVVDSRGNVVFEVAHPEGRRAHPLSWSPDGNTILYLVFQTLPDGTFDQVIYSLDISSLNWTQLTKLDNTSDFDAVWTPDGQQIIYESEGLRIMNRDGTGSRTLISADALGNPRRVALSPDGHTLATQPSNIPDGNGSWDIWLVDVNGENPRNLTNTPDWDEENPSWSPDGRFLLYDGWPKSGHRPRIFIHDVVTGERRVFFETGSSVEPQWISGTSNLKYTLPISNIGIHGRQEEVFFIYDGALWSTLADGSHVTRLTDSAVTGRVTGYSWAPEGAALVFVSESGLWWIDPSTQVLRRLVDNSELGNVRQAAWSPNGNSLGVMIEKDRTTSSLYLMSPDGSVRQLLLDDVSGALSWAGPYMVLRFRTEGNPEEYVAWETKLNIIDPRTTPPQSQLVSNDWVMSYTSPGFVEVTDISADQQWISFNDLGVVGVAAITGSPVQDAPGGYWRGNLPLITFTKYDEILTENRLFEFDPATGKERDLGVSAKLARFSPDGEIAVVSTDKLELRYPDGTLTFLANHTAGELQWSPTGRAVLYSRTIDRPDVITSRMHMWSVETTHAGFYVVSMDNSVPVLVIPGDATDVTWRPQPSGTWVTLEPPLKAQGGTYNLRIRTTSARIAENPWAMFGEAYITEDGLKDAGIVDAELTFNDISITDPDEIRRILYLYVAAYHLYRSPETYFQDLNWIDEELDAVLNNPMLMVPGLGTILLGEPAQTRQAWRAVLGKTGTTNELKDLVNVLAKEFESAASVGDAALAAAYYSDKVWVQQIALQMFGDLRDWKISGQVLTIKSAKIPVPATGWLTLASLLVELYAVDYLSTENVELFDHYSVLLAGSTSWLDAAQLTAVEEAKKGITDLTPQRKDILEKFMMDRFADVFRLGGAAALPLFATWTAETLGAQSAAAVLTANLGQVVSGGLLGFAVGGYLMGIDDLYDHFVLASRANDIRRAFQTTREETETAAKVKPTEYSAIYADRYRTSLRLEMLAAAQVRSSYINGVAATMEKGALSPVYLADQLKGGELEDSIKSLQEETQETLNSFDKRFVHRPAVEALTQLITRRGQYAAILRGNDSTPDYVGVDVESTGADTRPIGTVNAAPLNMRSDPSTTGIVIDQLSEGLSLMILERSEDALWLRVRLPDSREGWVYAEYVTIPSSSFEMENPRDEGVSCAIAVDKILDVRWSQGALGCPTGASFHTWASWQVFERGAMLWREDEKVIYTLGNDMRWQRVPDVWNGGAMSNSRGAAPAGLQAPSSGFGYLWETDNDVFVSLGWAREGERGSCLIVQPFERGEIMKSVGTGCSNGLYSHGQDSSFSLQFLILQNAGDWSP